MTAFSSGLRASIRSIAASTSSVGLASPERTSSAWAVASRRARSAMAGDPIGLQKRFEADRDRVGQLAHAPDRQQHPGHERAAIDRVVADGQRLPLAAEDHLLMGDEPL